MQLTTGTASAYTQFDAAQKQLEEGWAEYNAGQTQLEESRTSRLQEVVDRFNGQQKAYKVVLVHRQGGAGNYHMNLALRDELSHFVSGKEPYRALHQVISESKEKINTHHHRHADRLSLPLPPAREVAALMEPYLLPLVVEDTEQLYIVCGKRLS